MKNPIIAELRRIRDEHAKLHNYDIQAIGQELAKLDPWMERKTYTLQRGQMVSVASLRSQKRHGIAARKAKVAKRK